MTDSEIIKCLEQAIDKYNKNEIFVDNIRLDKLSLDIIKRQQVEIEKYKNNCEKCGAKTRECIESLHNIIAEQQAEIERLISEKDVLIKAYQEIQVSNLMAFVKSLCKDRVSNDPVVIAAQVELKEWLGDTE